MARTKYTQTPGRGYTGSPRTRAETPTSQAQQGPSYHELHMNALRAEYSSMHNIFTKNNLDPGPFARRLKGELNIERIREGLVAMRDYLIAHKLMDDPVVRSVHPDNLPEYERASRESADDWLRATPERAPAPPSRPAPTPSPAPTPRPTHQIGCEPVEKKFYMVGTTPFHVVRGRNGHLYARSRNPKTGRWEYQKGAIFNVRKHGRLATVEDIAKFGLASGRCFVCGKALSTPESVKRGIGPTCIKHVS